MATNHADDNQLYMHCHLEDTQSAVLSVQQCVSVIQQWMAASRLRLNMDKTELMWTGTKYNVSKIPICCHSLTQSGAQIIGSDPVHVLGVLLMPDLSLDKHVTAVSANLPSVSFTFDSCIASNALSTTTRPLLLSTLSLPAGSTTVAVS